MAATDFTGFTDETLAFLRDLKADNTKEWFAANKASYEAAVKKPAQAFAQVMAGELERLTGVAQKPKIFRINRDLRFSKDKTPYNTHIHISWTPIGGTADSPAFMFGLSTEYCTLGCGVFEFSKPGLAAYRSAIAGADGDDLAGMIDAMVAQGCRVQEPALKRVPAGFPDDHPHVNLSLHKGIAVWRDLENPQAATSPDIMTRCLDHFTMLLPLWRFVAILSDH